MGLSIPPVCWLACPVAPAFYVNGDSGNVANCGGAWNNSAAYAGASSCKVNWNSDNTNSNIGARLAAARPKELLVYIFTS